MKAKLTYILLASVLLVSPACQKEYTDIEGSKSLSFSVSLADAGTKADAKSSNVVFTDENGNPAPFTINLSVEDTKVESLTKGIPITNKEDFKNQVKEFRAWGWYDNTPWTGITDAEIRQVEDGSDEYRPYEGGQFINAYNSAATATGNYHFYAQYPYDLTGTGATLTSGPTIANGMTFSYSSPGGTGGTTDAELQKEVLAGYLGTGANMANVPITFTPILAAIRFQVGEHMEHDITINSIELKNFYYTGTCVVKAGADPVVEWTTTTTSKRNFKQVFDKDIETTDSGMDINADDLSKTFFVVPQTCSSEMGSGGSLNGGMIIINYTEKDEHGVKGAEEHAQHLVFGNTFEAGKTYIYKIGKFDDDPADLEPWVEFSNFQVNLSGLLGKTNEIHEENNSKFIFNFAQQNGDGEKAYFNIYNLEVGHWYSIDFTERATLYDNNGKLVPQTFNTSGQGCYACSVVYKPGNKENTERAYGDQLIYQNFLNQETFIWEHPDDIYNTSTYNPFYTDKDHFKTARITFMATQPTMQWEWDFSSGRDGYILRSEIYLVGDKIKDITPKYADPSNPSATVDFQNATLHNFNKNSNWDSYSSMKTYAVDATAETTKATGELFFRVVNGGYGRINIPLTNLDPAKKYKIKYTIDKKGTKSNRTGNNYGLGYLIQGSPNTNNNTFNPTTNANYISFKGTYTSQTDFNFTESFEFSPTASTMYWVWDFSEFATGNSDHQFVTFSDVTIEEVTP